VLAVGTQLDAESTLTDKYQTTIPDPIRRALKLKKRDKICFSLQADGTVMLTRVAIAERTDPVTVSFLQALAADMTAHPERLRGVSSVLVKRARAVSAKSSLP
jgi:antitoxin PrlF